MGNVRLAVLVRGACAALFVGVLWATPTAAQGTFDAGVQVTWARSGEFDTTTTGAGGRLAWHPSGLVGVEAEFNVYPEDWPDATPFSQGQREGLFGITVGPRLGGIRPFAKVRGGFLNVQPSPGAFACILIFPPPLSCQLAGGATLPALDYGAGVEIGGRVFLRLEGGDRVVGYKGPVLDTRSQTHDERFWSHDFRFGLGAGVRF
jgi:hypothetical protein